MLILNIVFIAAIVFIIYWFWLAKGKKPQVKSEGQWIEIVVDKGVYTPSVIEVPVSQPVKLRFLRKAVSPCAGTVVFADFNESAELPLNKKVELILHPEDLGEFEFTCEMGMYRGRIIVS